MGIIEKIKDINKNYFISASAGTGKTYTITHFYVKILSEYEKQNYPEIIDRIVVTTFTKKAAAEMKERIFKLVEPHNSPYWHKVKNYLPRAIISTIDSFCQRLLREENINANIDPNFTIISDLKMSKLIDRAVFLTLKLTFQLYDFGKTNVRLNISKHRKENIEKLLEKLKDVKEGIKELFNIYKSINEIEKILQETLKNWRTEMKRSTVSEKILENGESKSLALQAFKYMVLISKEIYEGFTIDNFEFDFKGVLEKTLDVLEDENIRKKYQERFKYIIIDEFQDTNYLQKELFDKLHTSKNYLFYVGDRKQSIYRFRNSDVSVFLKTQKDFEKNNEEVLALKENYRSNSALVEYFNFISKNKIFNKQLVTGVEKYETFKTLEPDIYEKLWFDEKMDLSISTISCEGNIPSLNDNEKGGRIKYIIVEEETKNLLEKEAEIAAFIVKKLVGKKITVKGQNGTCIDKEITYGDFAILRSRLKDAEDVYKSIFEKYGIPLHVIGGKSFYKQLEILAILNALFAVQNPNNNYFFTRYFFSPLVLGTFKEYDEIVKNRREDETLFETAKRIKFKSERDNAIKILEKYAQLKYYIRPTEILKGLINDLNYLEKLAFFEDRESAILNVKKLLLEAQEFDQLADSFLELVKLIQKIGDTQEAEASIEDESSESVKLMTIHASKGLEFKIVILGDLYDKQKENSNHLRFYNKKGTSYFMLTKIMNEFPFDIVKEFYLDEIYNETELSRKMYVAITRASEMFIPIIFSRDFSNTLASYIMLEEKELEKLKEKVKSFELIKLKDVKLYAEKHENKRKKETIPLENLTDFSHLSYKSYISPTTLYGFLGNEKEAQEEDITFALSDKTFQGSQIHKKLSNINTLSQLKYLENTDILPVKISTKIGFLFENSKVYSEWRLVKPFYHEGRKYMLFGIPDKVIFKDEKIYVIDFKNVENLKDEKYKFQIQFYMYLLHDFGKVHKGYILSTKTGDILMVKYENNFEELIHKAIEIFEKVKL
ncbi:DNA helicase UvrD [Thermosipho melanesiensis]|uniref:DNA 3'-5' helicase n=2 Tax=Thermosipho melanesiensis TaxID=46541 RepID=A6LK36_THEM4|nr:UvrD-helicase domain-containing protein [Thermosipho melanesiensis]ABR30287.1 UvrD/REP helicase [Thermosipho melanesiensis BI429]APT73465.1 DNA helicase UvrD [Thermosipho melanesiensis]OOC37410.1 DNA helicase UvrD [Thermosipho melanesiensis]OOC39772.1 DNA helicase UvrD [Thermosipho melanesiensis]OOC39877.1 DNA helicase UvrD [Thermosipho melanesiensis]